MNLNLKTCIFAVDEGSVIKVVNVNNFCNLGFDCTVIKNSFQQMLEYMSCNKVDILVVEDSGFDKERFKYILDIVHTHFCKNLIIISDDIYDEYKQAIYIKASEQSNLDLKLSMSLLKLKKIIELSPSRNVNLIKNKIRELLCKFMFSCKHDGFSYYVEAILLAYLKFPYNYSTMEIYKEIALKYGKTFSAVEKSMRTALISAFKKLKDAPPTQENTILKGYLTYDMNNNMAISMFLSRLVVDKDLIDRADNLPLSVFYQ